MVDMAGTVHWRDDKQMMSNNSSRVPPTSSKKAKSNRKKKADISLPNSRQTSLDGFVSRPPLRRQEDENTSAEFDLENELKEKDRRNEQTKLEVKKERVKTEHMRQQRNERVQRSREAVIATVRQVAQLHRKERARPNPSFGFFIDAACAMFEEGEYLTSLRAELKSTQEQVKKQRTKDAYLPTEQKAAEEGKLEYNKKRIEELLKEIEVRQGEVNKYKDKLRLGVKEARSMMYKEEWPLLKSRYQPLRLIGSGGFAEVYLGFDCETYTQVAIKILTLDEKKLTADGYDNGVKHYEREVKTLRSLKHPNIVTMIDQIEMKDDKIGLVMEYCNGEELKGLLNREGTIKEDQAKKILRQVFCALKYLEQQTYRVIHYDLKPANILFHQGVVKILDFGICKIMEKPDESNIELTSADVGTFWYLPPEIFDRSKTPLISSKVDVWSAGVVFYELLFGCKPFGQGMSQGRLRKEGYQLLMREVEFPEESLKKGRVSKEATEFIQACLQRDQKRRLSARQAYDHVYFK